MKRFITTLSISLFIVTSAFAATTPPKGAIKLSKGNQFKVSNYYCGFVKKKWIPGRLISGGYFYSHSAERSNFQTQYRKAKGKTKQALKKKIDALKAQIDSRSEVCLRGNVTPTPTPTFTPTPLPTATPQPLRFSLTDAVGLALGEASSDAFAFADSSLVSTQAAGGRSNMRKVNSAGQLSEVVSSGTVSINKFLIAPNDKLYVLFDSKTNLEDTSSSSGTCLLAEVDPTSGNPNCVEDEITSIDWLTYENGASSYPNTSIQFDNAGAIYYLGSKADGTTVLRKNANGNKSDLINDNISIRDFLVLGDGRVLIAGSTNSTNANWLRRISASGGLTNLYTGNFASFVQKFPDGNVYIGSDGFTGFGWGVNIYLAQSDTTDSRPYFSYDSQNPYISSTLVCPHSSNPFGFCSTNGGLIQGLHRTLGGKIFAVAGSSGHGELMQYYPSLSRVVTSVSRVSVFQGVINDLILAGLNSSNKNVMTLFNTSDSSEVQLIGADNEIEVYHLNYVSASNKILFDGLRFSDNKYVIGQYDLNTMTLSASQTGSAKLLDLQALN